MVWQEFIVDASRLWAGSADDFGPVALIDLDCASPPTAPVALPSCPVIGFGNPAHPLAAHLDAVAEPAVGLARLVRQITTWPRVAAVLVDLLRILPDLGDQDALLAESLAYGLLQGSEDHAQWLAANAGGLAGPPGQLIVDRQDGLLRLTLDRPASGNAIDRALRDQLDEAFALAGLDATITHVVLQANGRCFSLGAELTEFGTTRDPATAHLIRRQTLPARHIARCAERLEARVQGACVGAGLEMAVWAKRLVAVPGAWFQLPELAMGLLPGAGGCVALTRRIGRQRTALMVLSGKRIPARIALGWGLIDGLVDDFAGDDGGPDVID
jgi:enoyl-CoA hydratase/carnithine racemase